jgi:Tol biopolymer transport system component
MNVHKQVCNIALLFALLAGVINAWSLSRPREPAGAITAEDLESVHDSIAPVLSPDGSKFALVREGQIFLLPISGGWPSLLTSTPGGKSEVAWAPDSHSIAYVSDGSIWVVPVQGGQPERLTDGTPGPGDPRVARDHSPKWNPRGNWILFQSGRSGQNELWVVSADGHSKNYLATTETYLGPEHLGDQPTTDGDGLAGGLFYPDPAWSPDGTHLTYTERSREFFAGNPRHLLAISAVGPNGVVGRS